MSMGATNLSSFTLEDLSAVFGVALGFLRTGGIDVEDIGRAS